MGKSQRYSGHDHVWQLGYVKRYGRDTPLDLGRLNSLLVTYRQPLTNRAEIDAFYGQDLPVGAVI